jgi:hypothetical protein
MRSIKPEMWDDVSLSKVSRDARLLYISMWNFADEEARMHGDARWIKGHCLPYDDDLNLKAIERLIEELTAAGKVVRYTFEGASYVYLPKLAKHQRLEPTKVPSRLPAPPLTCDDSSSESCADLSAPRADSSEQICAKHVAGGMEHVAGSMLQVASREPAQTAAELVAEHSAAHKTKPPSAVLRATTVQVRALLEEDYTPDQLRESLDALRRKGLGPGALPSVLNEVINAPPRVPKPRSTTDHRVSAALDLAARFATQEQKAISK